MSDLAKLLKELEVSITSTYLGMTPTEGRMGNMDKFSVTVSRGKVSYTASYHSGFGHRKAPRHSVTPVPANPTVDAVVACLIIDANSVNGDTFRDYCDNMGSCADSREALETYLTCQDTLIAMRRMFGEHLATVIEYTQDY